MATAEITIRGAGIFGLSVAWACAKRGARVQVIDPGGVGAGASGGIVGALAPHVPENWNAKKQFQLDSLLAAQAFWAEIEAASGLASGYGRTGRLQPIRDREALALAHARAETARELWGGHAEWQVLPAEQAGLLVPPSPTGWVIRDTLSARLHPAHACAALAGALAARGVPVLREGTECGLVLHATGAAGLEELGRDTGRSAGAGIKGQAALLQFDARDAPQVFADALHFVPHDDGTLAIGSTTERTFASPTETDAQLDDLMARARAILPEIAQAPVLSRWAGLRPRARSRAPLLGPWPGRDGHFVANGGFKIGFGMAVGVAEVMADLLVGGVDRIPADFHTDAL